MAQDDSKKDGTPVILWRPSLPLVGALIFFVIALILSNQGELVHVWRWWMERPEYSHGVIMPFLSGFLIWQQKDQLEKLPISGSLWGILFTVGAVFLLFIGKFGSVMVLVQYASVLIFCGLVFSLVGKEFFKHLLVPLSILVLMIPPPEFIFKNLTAGLQLLSSEIGVSFIRLFGVSVFLEGNVIDLGAYKLEVAEACSGLRYLFPLMTLSFIMAYFFRALFWKRTVLFLSSIPITILMNSFRIGAIGILVDRWGESMAEGFLHDFEGWLIFMASTAILLLEIFLFCRFSSPTVFWRDAFGFEMPLPSKSSVPRQIWKTNIYFMISSLVAIVAIVFTMFLPTRVEQIPVRNSFAEFPLIFENWRGYRATMEQIYIDALKLDDYTMVNYVDEEEPGQNPIQFYSAWYNSQRAGESAHSPKTCMPGGGWQILEIDRISVDRVLLNMKPLFVNRVLIGQGESKQLVYYWFQQRGRIITNEYMVKWYLFWDSLTKNRTDGALVRLVVPISEGQSVELVEHRLQRFLSELAPRLSPFLPS